MSHTVRAIALAIARERPNCDIVATDISADALAIARENARQHELPNIEFRHGDWTAPVASMRFDLIVCNPPYVPESHSDFEKLRHEPRTALAGGPEGLDAIRRIAAETVRVTMASGELILEHGDTQAENVREILAANGWQVQQTVTDLAGKPRVSIGSISR